MGRGLFRHHAPHHGRAGSRRKETHLAEPAHDVPRRDGVRDSSAAARDLLIDYSRAGVVVAFLAAIKGTRVLQKVRLETGSYTDPDLQETDQFNRILIIDPRADPIIPLLKHVNELESFKGNFAPGSVRVCVLPSLETPKQPPGWYEGQMSSHEC